MIREQWRRWDPGVPLHVLRTDYASVVDPIVAFIDELSNSCDDQIVVLIPVVIPDRLRYRLLHNHMDSVLSAALRSRTDLVVARVPMASETDRSLPSRLRTAEDSKKPESGTDAADARLAAIRQTARKSSSNSFTASGASSCIQ